MYTLISDQGKIFGAGCFVFFENDSSAKCLLDCGIPRTQQVWKIYSDILKTLLQKLKMFFKVMNLMI